ncbi:glycosyltransferase [Actinoallomurus iriomotensis]|uniref:Glycosyl transferase n=1 Tax=Actinoallomurus iriomotensis TaxID=478107 RepID=A0A9W6RSX3_9ACTN|nr:glycosyltransferase [Actinoallomurus iriomotensis]GLY81301.1 glycosyl transferase [Actinoallomurus iriomotensis]
MGPRRRPTEGALDVVIPARNEAARLTHGLATLSGALSELPVPATITVVDSASTDATAEIARRWSGPVPVRLLRCPRPGKGAAVRSGLLATTAPYVGFCDADMATGLDVLPDVLAMLRSGTEVIIGSRRHPESDVEIYGRPLRRVGALTFNRLCRDLTGGVTDTQCGFKFFAGPLARAAAAELRTAGFAFDVELLVHCRRRGAAITEIPVTWRDMPGSTFSITRHAAGCLRDLLRVRAAAHRPVAAPPLVPIADELRAG